MTVEKLSSDAESFPDLEVEYEDLLELGYAPDRRAAEGQIDCLGVVLEVYRRAGLGLPDPRRGRPTTEFQGLFEQVAAPDALYDLVNLDRGCHHLYVCVRSGVLLSARAGAGVYAIPAKRLAGKTGTTYWRLTDAARPV